MGDISKSEDKHHVSVSKHADMMDPDELRLAQMGMLLPPNPYSPWKSRQ